MSHCPCAILVVAKAPVAGLAKTRLAPVFGPEGAADLAAAALLDTLVAVQEAEVGARIVAITGDLAEARRAEEISRLLEGFTVIEQRGGGFAERLSAAHAEAGALAGTPVLQIGMDTPQVSPAVLSDAAASLTDDDVDAVFGPAVDGGWWALGLTDPRMASALERVPMSRPDTGVRTLAALADRGVVALHLPELADVDSAEDVWSVADQVAENSHFRLAADRHRE
jgi:glycosyltransferase A (GT-A) superfamily protein (DUF2064 family)